MVKCLVSQTCRYDTDTESVSGVISLRICHNCTIISLQNTVQNTENTTSIEALLRKQHITVIKLRVMIRINHFMAIVTIEACKYMGLSNCSYDVRPKDLSNLVVK